MPRVIINLNNLDQLDELFDDQPTRRPRQERKDGRLTVEEQRDIGRKSRRPRQIARTQNVEM